MQSFERPLSRNYRLSMSGSSWATAAVCEQGALLSASDDHELPNAQLRSCHSGRGKRTVAWPRMRQQEVVMLSAYGAFELENQSVRPMAQRDERRRTLCVGANLIHPDPSSFRHRSSNPFRLPNRKRVGPGVSARLRRTSGIQ